MGGANAQDPQGWKRPSGLWGVGLRLKEKKGPRRAPTPGLRGQGTGLGAQQAPRAEWAGQSPSTPPPFLPEGPSRLPLLTSPASLLCSQGPPQPGGVFGAQGIGLGAQQAPWPQWTRRSPSTPLPLFQESPSRLPLLISPASGAPILSGLHSSSPLSPLMSY